MIELLQNPIPWYIAGPLIGLTVPLLLLIGNKTFGISSSFQHVCAAVLPNKFEYFNYHWWDKGKWHIQLAIGIVLGGLLASFFIPDQYQIALSENTVGILSEMGISNFQGYVPAEIFNWDFALSLPGLLILGVGGFLIGFGTRYAGGCTSGHAITGLATLQKASLIAVIGFFVGGLITTYLILPFILG